jgi:hypothetical protein
MSEHLTKLVSIGTVAIIGAPAQQNVASLIGTDPSPLLRELFALLAEKNGFFSFESALLVRPLYNERQPSGILQWNNPKLWKKDYKIDLTNCTFFAEDIFGIQFCIKDNTVQSFDPEMGQFKEVGTTLELWASWIFDKHQLRTGWPLAHQWQAKHGSLPPGMRLLPKVPFVCGGQFALENFYSLNDAEGMRFRASIANQLMNVPDGSKVVLKIAKHQ